MAPICSSSFERIIAIIAMTISCSVSPVLAAQNTQFDSSAILPQLEKINTMADEITLPTSVGITPAKFRKQAAPITERTYISRQFNYKIESEGEDAVTLVKNKIVRMINEECTVIVQYFLTKCILHRFDAARNLIVGSAGGFTEGRTSVRYQLSPFQPSN